MRYLFITFMIAFSFGSTFANANAKQLPENLVQIQLSFSSTVKKVSPSVVNVFSTKIVAARKSVFDNDPFFNRFFLNRRFTDAQPRVLKSLGSGVMVSDTGLVVTNYHVVKDAVKIRIVLADMKEYDAVVILEDKRTDLAILQIESKGDVFQQIDFADSDRLEVGDLVLAIGNPYGVGQSVTSGIVSAIARTNVGISDFQFFIQTDAAINPGNSGGALVDSLGRLIGINTAIFSRSGGSNGIGFAIPSNMVKLVVESAQIGSDVKRPWMGVEMQSLSIAVALSLGLEKAEGIILLSVPEGTPLFNSGVNRGDVIIGLDGNKVISEQQFSYMLATKHIGDVVKFTILRDDTILAVNVTMLAAPEIPPRRQTVITGNAPFAGAEVLNISPAVIEEMSLPLGSEGVIIIDVINQSKALRYGFQIGDVILSVSNKRIRRVGDLLDAARFNKRFWRFSILRNGRIINTIVNG